MYEKFMDLIEHSAEDLAQSILKHLKTKDDFATYQKLPQEVLYERIYLVIRNVYRRLGNWLKEDKAKATLFAYYNNLGMKRFREGIPLEEVIKIMQFIKGEIWHLLRENIHVLSDFDLKRLMEIDYYVNLFFDRISSAIIAGYMEEIGKHWKDSGAHHDPMMNHFFR